MPSFGGFGLTHISSRDDRVLGLRRDVAQAEEGEAAAPLRPLPDGPETATGPGTANQMGAAPTGAVVDSTGSHHATDTPVLGRRNWRVAYCGEPVKLEEAAQVWRRSDCASCNGLVKSEIEGVIARIKAEMARLEAKRA